MAELRWLLRKRILKSVQRLQVLDRLLRLAPRMDMTLKGGFLTPDERLTDYTEKYSMQKRRYGKNLKPFDIPENPDWETIWAIVVGVAVFGVALFLFGEVIRI